MARGSFPYMIVLGGLTLMICVFLWVLFDVAVVEITATSAWGNGSDALVTGQERAAGLWRYSLVFIVTGSAFTLLLSSRRGA